MALTSEGIIETGVDNVIKINVRYTMRLKDFLRISKYTLKN